MVWDELMVIATYVLTVAKRKKHSKQLNVVRTSESLQQTQSRINHDSRKFMIAFTYECSYLFQKSPALF